MMTADEIEAVDRFCCELEEARREPVIAASAWGQRIAHSQTPIFNSQIVAEAE